MIEFGWALGFGALVAAVIMPTTATAQTTVTNIKPMLVLDSRRNERWAGNDDALKGLIIEFENLLMAQFAANPLCHGISIARTGFKVPDNLMKERHWNMAVQHAPPPSPLKAQEQHSWVWMLNEEGGSEIANNFMFVEGMAKEIVATVCAIVTAQGAVTLSK